MAFRLLHLLLRSEELFCPCIVALPGSAKPSSQNFEASQTEQVDTTVCVVRCYCGSVTV